LGVEDADPEEYRRRYGNELKQSHEIPNVCPEPYPRPSQPTPAPCNRQSTARVQTPPAQCGCKPQAPPTLRIPTPRIPTPPQQQSCGCPQIQRNPTPQPSLCGGACGNFASQTPQLEGDVDALRLVDLDRHGLSQYKKFVQ
jgi:hypothetical protein